MTITVAVNPLARIVNRIEPPPFQRLGLVLTDALATLVIGNDCLHLDAASATTLRDLFTAVAPIAALTRSGREFWEETRRREAERQAAEEARMMGEIQPESTSEPVPETRERKPVMLAAVEAAHRQQLSRLKFMLKVRRQAGLDTEPGPDPSAIRAARQAAGMSLGQAGDVIGQHGWAWQIWETGQVEMPAGFWSEFNEKMSVAA
ncbi:hypothetical protein HLH33_00540 [Gluconacetobacter diazotrophicus]|uniref:Uncharacterized protein n=1 Tax=Gluconacetobacter diazotrophicus TaxID=33996 RepID=A0A7W4FBP5_GLUDI|nr:hypothetical protein [Gluconacetobacter diazotrophicus]MBB2154808.1 hypothetical protein [Gluconacetobacter diazotrophicus]